MSVLLLTVIGAVLIAGPLWLVLGSRLTLHDSSQQNDLLNLAAYAAGSAPVVFVLVFFVLGA